MFNHLKIKATNEKYIYGELEGNKENPLIIFVHGFSGSKNESKYINGADFFNKLGFSSFRFNFCDNNVDSKKLEDITLSVEASDLDCIFEYFTNEGVKKIFVVGHSFGGLVVLLTKSQHFNAAVLWDTAVDTKLTKEEFEAIENKSFNKNMFEENNRLDPLTLIANMHVPIKLIWAQESILGDLDHAFFEKANNPKEAVTIKAANHDFIGKDIEEKLFQETYEWIKRFL